MDSKARVHALKETDGVVVEYIMRDTHARGVFAALEHAHKVRLRFSCASYSALTISEQMNSPPLTTQSIATLTALVRLVSQLPRSLTTSSRSATASLNSGASTKSKEPDVITQIFTAETSAQLERALNPARNDTTNAVLRLASVLCGWKEGRLCRLVWRIFNFSAKVRPRHFGLDSARS